MTQFIGIYENAFSKKYCEKIISYFDTMQKNGYTENRMQAENAPKTIKNDDAFYGHLETSMNMNFIGKMHSEFNEQFWKIYIDNYASQFDILQTAGKHNNYSFKIQKTPIGGGYHIWHFESSQREVCHRIMTWMLYLNDVEEGGETEFLYQHKRIKPKQGTLLIWPAGFTHTHRGNPPLSNDKYVITGWCEF